MVTQCFPPKTGGIETVMSELASLLNTNNNLEVITKHSKNAVSWDNHQSFPITRIHGNKFLRQWRIKRIIKQKIKSYSCKILITDSWKSAKTILPIAKKFKLPIISLAHGNDVLTKNKTFRKNKITHTLRECQHVVAVSDTTKKMVLSLGISNCSTINNGINIDAYINTDKKICFKAPQLLTVARLEKRKGQDRIIEALPSLIKDYPNIHYHIAGTGQYETQLKSLVDTLGVNEHVTFHGYVNEGQKKALLRQADLFVMPVRHDKHTHSIEGFGISLVEAQLAGLPVLTGQSGGVSDVVTHKKTGFICDGDDTLAVSNGIYEILDNIDLALICAKEGQKNAQKKFSHQFMIEQYQKLIYKITS